MEKSFALVLPDRPGALRDVTRMLSVLGVSVLRASYNRVVDVHTFFLDVSGTSAAIARAEDEFRARFLFPQQREVGRVELLEFELDDTIGAFDPVLALLERYELNITFFDARTDVENSNVVQVGVYVNHPKILDSVLEDAKSICPVRVVNREHRLNMLDNNHFTLTFAHGLAQMLDLSSQEEQEILVNANRIMQNLMHQNDDPYKPFDFIYQIGQTLARYNGPSFARDCRITRLQTCMGVSCVCIEPPAGSTTWIFECDDQLLCVDAGYRCFAAELEGVLRGIYPDWDARRKELFLTHGDMDHIGAWDRFDKLYASGRTIDGFAFESMGIVNWREQNPHSFPYNRVGSTLSKYQTPDHASIACLGEASPFGEQQELLRQIDILEIPPLSFEVWEGKGGHVRGETMLIERSNRVCVSGDVFVNVHGETKPQARFNALAPFLMTSVDSVPDLARQERSALFHLLDEEEWLVFGGHGSVYSWNGNKG